jgi:pilus assembly protein CpaB
MSKGGRLTLALALGLLAALFGMIYLASKRDEILGSSEVVRVYVATDDIKPNTVLDAAMLTVRQVPKTYLQPQSILVSEFPDKGKVKGVTLVPIKRNEQIVRTKLYEGAPPPLSSELKNKPDMVAVGIDIQALPNAIHGLVKPGDHVDVLASFKFEKTKDEDFTEIRPLYQNVEVLAVNDKTAGNVRIANDQKSSNEASSDKMIKTVTLALPPPAAQQVILTQQLGNIWLLLRAPGDNTQHQYEIWNNERLLRSPFRLWHAQGREELLREIVKK